MDATVIVGTYGAFFWAKLACSRAIPSAQPMAPVIHVHGKTLAEARNEGADRATTEWLCFLDADDELAPGYFDAMAAAATDLRGPMVEYIHPDGLVERVLWPERDLRDGNYLVIGTLVRRELFHQVGGFREWPLYEDWCLWQRCALAGATISMVPDAVYRAHVRPQSRNRPSRAARLAARNAIRAANYPAAEVAA